MKFSIVICTYNRDSILPFCLASFDEQPSQEDWEIIVIDNNSTDRTSEVVKEFQKKYSNLIYVKELNQGLSHARNRGYMEAKGEWIVYIDDDAKLAPGYIKRLEYIISNYDFDCFGGIYTAWYLTKKPVWLSNKFGNKSILRNDIGLIDGTTGLLSGGNFAIKRSVLEAIGGFDTKLGMRSDQIAYGEEDRLQQELFEVGYKIGFDPGLMIEHAVLPHKLNLGWHLESAYQKGIIWEYLNKEHRSWYHALFEVIKTCLGLLLKRLPVSLYKMFTRKKYYWQNLVLDTIQPVYFHLGKLRQYLRHN